MKNEDTKKGVSSCCNKHLCMFSLIRNVVGCFTKIPNELIILMARFGMAATFWLSGQTKVEGFKLNFLSGEFEFGWPRLSDSVVALFADEYKLPVLSPEFSALMAASAEHVFPILLLLGLATRFSALALLGMTAVIQVFVYPDAYATHATWAACLLFLMVSGAGKFSLDYVLWGRRQKS